MPKTRKTDATLALDMYAARVDYDEKAGNGDMHKVDNARALYFKGVYDVITCIETWVANGITRERIALLLQELDEQTALEANA